MAEAFTQSHLKEWTHQLCRTLDDVDVIYRKRNRIVIRTHVEQHGSVIVKMYARPDWKGFLRRVTRSGTCDYDWKGLLAFQRIGVRAPEPLGHCHIPANPAHFTDAIIMEDLGDCTTATDHLKMLIEDNRIDDQLAFEEALIVITQQIIEGGYVDTDHGLVNSLVRTDGELCRMDVELVRKIHSPHSKRSRTAYGFMFGRLLSSYIFAVQPDVQAVESFAFRVKERMHPSTLAWQIAAQCVDMATERQFQEIGLRMTITLP